MKHKRKIDAMHGFFGVATNRATCEKCQFFTRYRYHDYNRAKCRAYGDTRSEATDWAGRWAACGLFDHPEKIAPGAFGRVMRISATVPAGEEAVHCEGQIGFYDMEVG